MNIYPDYFLSLLILCIWTIIFLFCWNDCVVSARILCYKVIIFFFCGWRANTRVKLPFFFGMQQNLVWSPALYMIPLSTTRNDLWDTEPKATPEHMDLGSITKKKNKLNSVIASAHYLPIHLFLDILDFATFGDAPIRCVLPRRRYCSIGEGVVSRQLLTPFFFKSMLAAESFLIYEFHRYPSFMARWGGTLKVQLFLPNGRQLCMQCLLFTSMTITIISFSDNAYGVIQYT